MSESKIITQYRDLKRDYPEHLLLVKIGDFYEAFEEDAKILANTCQIALTSRKFSRNGDRVHMAGVPHFTLNKYVDQLIAAGHDIALGEEIGRDKIQGLLPRQVTKLITGA